MLEPLTRLADAWIEANGYTENGVNEMPEEILVHPGRRGCAQSTYGMLTLCTKERQDTSLQRRRDVLMSK